MSAITTDIARPAGRWTVALAALGAMLLALGLLYRDTLAVMVGTWWRSETFAHAFLVPPISLWLIWRQRDRLARMVPSPQPWVVVPMLLVLAGWVVSHMAAVNAGAQFALVGLAVLAVPAALGLPVARSILFPLLFLFFCVPFGEFLFPVLMAWTADFTVAALRLSGIPVYREGLRFVIPSGSWSVVEACSGVRYLIASLMVGSLFAYLNYRSMKRRAVFIAVSILVPIVANWLRAYMIVMLGHLSNNTIAVGVDHLIYGWLFFGVVITIMFAIGARWSEPDEAPATPAHGLAAGAGAGVSPSSPAAFGIATVLVVGALLAPRVLLHRADAELAAAPVPRLTLPETLGGWKAAAPAGQAWRPKYEGASAIAERSYEGEGGQVAVFVAYYRAQTYERKLISSQNTLQASSDYDWNHVGSVRGRVDLGGGALLEVTDSTMLGAGPTVAAARRLTVRQWYWVDDAFVAGDAAAKLRGAFGRLAGRGDDAAAIILSTQEPSDDKARALLASFIKSNLPVLHQTLRAARDAR